MYEGTLFNEDVLFLNFFLPFALLLSQFFRVLLKEGTERPPPGEGIQTHSPSFKCHKSKEK